MKVLTFLFDRYIGLLSLFVAMIIVAQIPTEILRKLSPLVLFRGILLLSLVLWLGESGQGAQRWLNIGIRFQPSEIMKLGVPMMVAWYLHEKRLPPNLRELIFILIIIAIPSFFNCETT